MEELSTLIRLHRLELDERRKALAAKEAILAQLLNEKKRLEDDLAAEAKRKMTAFEGEISRGAYVQATLKKIKTLESAIVTAEEQVEKARETLREAFEEVKRFEIARDIHIDAAEKEAARRETKELDEIGGEAKRRQKAEK